MSELTVSVDRVARLLKEAADELDLLRGMSRKQQLDHRLGPDHEDRLKDLAYSLNWAAQMTLERKAK